MSLQKFIQNIPLDKKEHVVLGVIYSALIPLLGFFFGFLGGLIGFVIGTSANIYKEVVHDKIQGKGTAEFWDFVATEAPILITFAYGWIGIY